MMEKYQSMEVETTDISKDSGIDTYSHVKIVSFWICLVKIFLYKFIIFYRRVELYMARKRQRCSHLQGAAARN